MKELALRYPSLFDGNGEDKNWASYDTEFAAYIQDEKIASVITYQFEPGEVYSAHIFNVHRTRISWIRNRQPINRLRVKLVSQKSNIEKNTICTDTNPRNKMPKLFLANGFKQFQ